MTVRRYLSRLVVPTALLMLIWSASVLRAQEKTDPLPTGSLASLTAEVHALRLAVEEAARSQTQTQALGVYLSAEQSRLVQVAGRLDAVRTELNTVRARARELADSLVNVQTQLAGNPQPEMRVQLQEMSRVLKQQADRAAEQEQAISTRESELNQAFQAEETRWAELIARLEQVIKK
jgi:chromosome segregation ATPase